MTTSKPNLPVEQGQFACVVANFDVPVGRFVGSRLGLAEQAFLVVVVGFDALQADLRRRGLRLDGFVDGFVGTVDELRIVGEERHDDQIDLVVGRHSLALHHIQRFQDLHSSVAYFHRAFAVE